MVAVGGGAGAVARYGLSLAAQRWLGSGWPFGTLAANVLGGLLMGMLATSRGHDQERLRLLLGVGILGGFTTFSAFSLETVQMIETRAFGQAIAYVALSVALSLGAVIAGLVLARRVWA